MKTYHDIATDGGSGVAEQVAAQEESLRDRLSDVDHIVAVMSGKGGVGKSMTTVLLATALAQKGLAVGIVDADINGASQVKMTGVKRSVETSVDGILPMKTAAGVEVMSIDLFLDEGSAVRWNTVTKKSTFTWRGMVEVAAIREMLADTAWSSLDVLFIDLPPGTDKLPNLLDLVPSLSASIVVSIPSEVSSYVVRKSVSIAREAFGERPILLVENMTHFVCPTCDDVHELFRSTGDRRPSEVLDLECIGSLPFDPVLSQTIDHGRTFDTTVEGSPTASAIRQMAETLQSHLYATSLS